MLVVDASSNAAGWETEFSNRLFTAMTRRGLRVLGERPFTVSDPEGLSAHQQSLEAANCLLILGPASVPSEDAAPGVASHWAWLKAHVSGPKLLAVCSWASYSAELAEEILRAPTEFAPLAVAQESPVTAREAGLFLLKFFTELDLHSDEQMTGRMAWFSGSKAKELLKRRRLEGRFGVRA